jgi:hypothetical protein
MKEGGAVCAKPSTELFWARIFGGAICVGDQNFRTCGPGAWAFPARPKGSQDEDVFRHSDRALLREAEKDLQASYTAYFFARRARGSTLPPSRSSSR